MSILETSELSSTLYELRAALGAALVHCQRERLLAVGCSLSEAQGNVNEAILKLEGTPEFAQVKSCGEQVLNTNNEAVRP